MDSNIQVHEHLHSYIKFSDVSISFADRLFFVTVKQQGFSGKDYVKDYLETNGFTHQSNGIYARFKNRAGEYISQQSFDNENNYRIREDMVERVLDRIPK
jgi:hypothetical protein